ncbi:unnamed protein product [Triticum turgidum subsp. durum]|uniref:Uncharacterized protein n=1 Tax=Triticum turgidum subsp. durum TaxID=4567 RepID=A0A9R1BUB1_TRITD|nr:unnamed protein product [Triticum turgidum subsp. durum]
MEVLEEQIRWALVVQRSAETTQAIVDLCGLMSGESAGYIAYYADNFNGTRLEHDVPQDGMPARRRRMLYETMAAKGNSTPSPGIMEQATMEE